VSGTTIRKETASDAPAIEAVTIAAFRDAAHASHTEHFIVRALRDSGQLAVSLVAVADGLIVGHVAVSPVTISDGSSGWFGLGPISVEPNRQGRGIGSLLMKGALAELRALGAAGCVVLGDPGYYSRFGFRAEPALVLPGVPPEYFQAIPFGSNRAGGQVTYADSFEATAFASKCSSGPAQAIAHVSLLVRDYDEAIGFYVDVLGFELIEDKPLPEQNKRWVTVAPPGGGGASLLLARASSPEQVAVIGAQTGGRVFLFLQTDDFWRDYDRFVAAGVVFVREPKQQPYGTVAVFQDLYGNLWDLLQYNGSIPYSPGAA